MITRVSTKGQVVVPSRIRRKLGLLPGDSLEARVEGQHIVLTPRKSRSAKARIIRDPVTGLPVLTAGPKARKLTSAEVREILAEFP
jgi:AbrB family looped-hinge helix DNA binding protein